MSEPSSKRAAAPEAANTEPKKKRRCPPVPQSPTTVADMHASICSGTQAIDPTGLSHELTELYNKCRLISRLQYDVKSTLIRTGLHGSAISGLKDSVAELQDLVDILDTRIKTMAVVPAVTTDSEARVVALEAALAKLQAQHADLETRVLNGFYNLLSR
jgi:hypothetical protein